jgi:hypothetical protein
MKAGLVVFGSPNCSCEAVALLKKHGVEFDPRFVV